MVIVSGRPLSVIDREKFVARKRPLAVLRASAKSSSGVSELDLPAVAVEVAWGLEAVYVQLKGVESVEVGLHMEQPEQPDISPRLRRRY